MFRALLQAMGLMEPPGGRKPDHPRSPHWKAVRAAHLKRYPACAACGATGPKACLQVHHIVPFHVDPSKELLASNLLTMCESPGRNCHLTHGHAHHWHGWVPTVREDAAAFLRRVRQSAERAAGGAAE